MANNNKGKYALGAVLAAVTGYVTGILTAPKSGKETREDIAAKAGEAKSVAEDQLHKAEAELKEIAAKIQSQKNELSGKARIELNQAATKAKKAQDKAGQILKAARAGKAKNPDLNSALKQAKEAKKSLAKFLKT